MRLGKISGKVSKFAGIYQPISSDSVMMVLERMIFLIQVDIVSGFLGAGKTTLITKLAARFMAAGQRVVVIENEYGQAGIDRTLLEQEGFSVVEITQGCICCTLRGDFTSAVLDIAASVRPDRILIEPSGIFMLSEALSIFDSPAVKAVCTVQSVVTIVDSLLYLRQSEHFSEFLQDQIHHASKLVLSKVDRVSPLSLEYVLQEIAKLHFHGDIVAVDLDSITDVDLAALLEVDGNIAHAGHCCQAHASHHHFDTLQITPVRPYGKDELQDMLTALSAGNYGSIVRLKGFVQGPAGILEISYVDGDFTVKERKRETAPVLTFIGVHLDSDNIKTLFE